MFNGSLDYTICSTDPDNYNRIACNLISPITKYASFIVTSLTANFDIIVLNKDDYITYQDCDEDEWIEMKISIKDEYKAMDKESALSALRLEICPEFEDTIESGDNTLYETENITKDLAGRYVMKRRHKWRIVDMSYNIRLMTGFYNTSFPIESIYDEESDKHIITANSNGFSMSTPILYLISNVGIQSYKTVSDTDICGAKIVMRVNNSYIVDTPISIPNGDFRSTILSNDLSMLTFMLVDANLHEIRLLSPIYITIHVDAVEDEQILPELLFYNKMHEDFKDIVKQKYHSTSVDEETQNYSENQ